MHNIDDYYPQKPLVEGTDFTLDPRGFKILTRKYLTERGYCCGNGCRNCPYHPKHKKGNTNLQ